MKAISETSPTMLKHINFYGNKAWFLKKENSEMLSQFLAQQQCLETLNLASNDLSASATETNVVAVYVAPCMPTTLKMLDLYRCNFESDLSCTALATIAAKAISLEHIDIQD